MNQGSWVLPECIELVDQRGTSFTAVVRGTRVPLQVPLDFIRRGIDPDEVARILGLSVEYAHCIQRLTRPDLTRVRWLERGVFTTLVTDVQERRVA